MEDGHKAFLQWMMVERVVSEDDLKKAIGTIKNIQCQQQDMFNFVLPIQHSLRHYGMDLSRLYFLPSEEYIWAIANLNSDPISQLATTYSATEVAIFKKILKKLSEENGYEVSQLDLASKIQASDPQFSASKIENLLQNFLNDFWLFKRDKVGKLLLGPKAVLELKDYLVEEELFMECRFCKSLIASGKVLKCPSCEDAKHQACYHQRCIPLAASCRDCKKQLVPN